MIKNIICIDSLQMKTTELPSPYVKTYLLPDPDKLTKRKTKIAKNTDHPTFNEVVSLQFFKIFLKKILVLGQETYIR